MKKSFLGAVIGVFILSQNSIGLASIQDAGQKFSFFCSDRFTGSTHSGCSSTMYSYSIPWDGPNLDHQTTRSADSDRFSELASQMGLYSAAHSYCQAKGYYQANSWPLISWTTNWFRYCR